MRHLLLITLLLCGCDEDALRAVGSPDSELVDVGAVDARTDAQSLPEDGGWSVLPDACIAFSDAAAPDAAPPSEYHWMFRGDLPRTVWTGTCETEEWVETLCSAPHLGQELRVFFPGGTELRGIDEPVMQGDMVIIDNLTDIARIRGGVRCGNSTETIEVVSVFSCEVRR